MAEMPTKVVLEFSNGCIERLLEVAELVKDMAEDYPGDGRLQELCAGIVDACFNGGDDQCS